MTMASDLTSASILTSAETSKVIWNASAELRALVGLETCRDYLFTLLFLKYVNDDWQSRHDNYQMLYKEHPELIAELLKSNRFALPEEAKFSVLYERRFEAGNGARIDQALHAMEDIHFSMFQGMLQQVSFNDNQLGNQTQKNNLLCRLLEEFGQVFLADEGSRSGDEKSRAGEVSKLLLERFSAAAGRHAAIFYTPAEIAHLMALLVNPEEGDEICDPACGSGALLIHCGQLIWQRTGTHKYALYGQEKESRNQALAKINLFLHAEDNQRIECGDTLRNPRLLKETGVLKQFDVVLSHLPFSAGNWGYEEAQQDSFKRFTRGMPPKTKGEYAFILHMIETLKPGIGRMIVLVPHGVLFRAAGERLIREKLIKENLLDAVIGLPEKIFYGHGMAAVLLIFRQKKADNKVLFIDASQHYQEGKNQNILRHQDMENLLQTYQARKNSSKYAYLATPEEIRDNDYNLHIPRYVDTTAGDEKSVPDNFREEREKIQAELAALQVRLADCLRALGQE